MDSLRVLFVGSDLEECNRMQSACTALNDDLVVPAVGIDEASEAISLQRFEAIVCGASVQAREVSNLATALRSLNKRSAGRTVLLSLGNRHEEVSAFDGHIPDKFGRDTLIQAMNSARNMPPSGTAGSSPTSELPVFELEEFDEQVGGDPEFMVEIIDLYLSERERQIPAMRAAIEEADYEALSRLAHTIKGSFGSLHATRARARAQELEIAAKAGNGQTCAVIFDNLMRDLAELEPQLTQLRDSVLSV
jgi:HPt (histidine-containing phosphotransfer) domain-containing protein